MDNCARVPGGGSAGARPLPLGRWLSHRCLPDMVAVVRRWPSRLRIRRWSSRAPRLEGRRRYDMPLARSTV